MKSCYPLEIEFEYNEELHSITPVLLQDEHDTILIDCGYPGFTNHLQHLLCPAWNVASFIDKNHCNASRHRPYRLTRRIIPFAPGYQRDST